MEIIWKGETEAEDRIREGTEILANEAGDAAEALAVSVKFWEKEELERLLRRVIREEIQAVPVSAAS